MEIMDYIVSIRSPDKEKLDIRSFGYDVDGVAVMDDSECYHIEHRCMHCGRHSIMSARAF